MWLVWGISLRFVEKIEYKVFTDRFIYLVRYAWYLHKSAIIVSILYFDWWMMAIEISLCCNGFRFQSEYVNSFGIWIGFIEHRYMCTVYIEHSDTYE